MVQRWLVAWCSYYGFDLKSGSASTDQLQQQQQNLSALMDRLNNVEWRLDASTMDTLLLQLIQEFLVLRDWTQQLNTSLAQMASSQVEQSRRIDSLGMLLNSSVDMIFQ